VLLAAALLATFSAPACRRKAPGPAECRTLALELARVTGSGALPRDASLKAQVDELTRECLLTPYDRELLRCVEESGRFRACRAEFVRRHRR
jgi:hypothetical protein